MKANNFISFEETLKKNDLKLNRTNLEILQVNVGKLCNQTCLHCHVEAGPKRKEIMGEKTVDRILTLLAGAPGIQTVDLTGGAPELNPYFRKLVLESKKLDKNIIDRCNLTVLFEKGQETTAQFLRDQKVQIVASLPCYSKENVEEQRGRGVFDKSIRALILLNEFGYGKEGTGLKLDLVYNPLGPFLPPDQKELETEYKDQLRSHFGISFNNLYTITNMPIKRFLWDLERHNKLREYMDLLLNSFNPQAALGVMCRNLVSVSWDGEFYDCDFNQMLEIPLTGKKKTIWDVEKLKELESTEIAFANHCYGCTAGSGSSCGGSLL